MEEGKKGFDSDGWGKGKCGDGMPPTGHVEYQGPRTPACTGKNSGAVNFLSVG